ncbi:DeoR family transcriptional regulator [Planctomycetales bacterium]|nr:DeoR family transcriptional regulator [Planctomycetales bacterium]
MLGVERNNFILATLEEKKAVTVAELAAALAVTEVTVRTLLNHLARQGRLRRTRGGAVAMSMAGEMDLSHKAQICVRQKKAIASAAYQYIEAHNTVYLDAGTTTLELAKKIKNGAKRRLTVVTNALNIATELLAEAADMTVILTGGELRGGVVSCVGAIAEQALSLLHFDKAFLGANHVSRRFGAGTPNLQEASVKRGAVEAAEKSYLLCDAGKFSGSSTARICPLTAFAAIITDDGLDAKTRAEFQAAQLPLVIAPTGN